MEHRSARRRRTWTPGAVGVLCACTAIAVLTLPEVRTGLTDASFSPRPGLITGAVDALVMVVQATRFVAPSLAALAVIAQLSFWWSGRRTERSRLLNRLSVVEYSGVDHVDHRSGRHGGVLAVPRRIAHGTGLAVLAVALVGATSGMEDEVTNGPLRPIERLVDVLGEDTDVTFVLQAPGVTFMDDSVISAQGVEALEQRLDVAVIPFGRHLYNLDDKSALELSVPDALYEEISGQALTDGCTGRTAIVDDTIGARVGEQVSLNGTGLTVAKVDRGIAQMNRSIALVADSTIRSCVDPHAGTSVYGALVATGDTSAVSSSLNGLDASAVSEAEFLEHNRDFWRANATPLILQLILYIALFAAFAAAGERQSALQRNAREVGILHATGVDFRALRAVETRRALSTVLRATVLAVPLMVAAVAAFNASELGVHIRVGVIEICVGLSLTLLSMLLASRRALDRFEKSLELPLAVKG